MGVCCSLIRPRERETDSGVVDIFKCCWWNYCALKSTALQVNSCGRISCITSPDCWPMTLNPLQTKTVLSSSFTLSCCFFKSPKMLCWQLYCLVGVVLFLCCCLYCFMQGLFGQKQKMSFKDKHVHAKTRSPEGHALFDPCLMWSWQSKGAILLWNAMIIKSSDFFYDWSIGLKSSKTNVVKNQCTELNCLGFPQHLHITSTQETSPSNSGLLLEEIRTIRIKNPQI